MENKMKTPDTATKIFWCHIDLATYNGHRVTDVIETLPNFERALVMWHAQT